MPRGNQDRRSFIRRLRLSAREVVLAVALTIAAMVFFAATVFDGARDGSEGAVASIKSGKPQ